jgi:hypothetical protein
MLHRDVPTLAADYGHVVIDGLPRNYEVTRSAIAAADLVLIPVQPSRADFWARRETLKLAEEARARGRGLPVPGWFWIRRHRRLAWDRRRPIISLNYARSAPSCCAVIGTSPAGLRRGRQLRLRPRHAGDRPQPASNSPPRFSNKTYRVMPRLILPAAHPGDPLKRRMPTTSSGFKCGSKLRTKRSSKIRRSLPPQTATSNGRSAHLLRHTEDRKPF